MQPPKLPQRRLHGINKELGETRRRFRNLEHENDQVRKQLDDAINEQRIHADRLQKDDNNKSKTARENEALKAIIAECERRDGERVSDISKLMKERDELQIANLTREATAQQMSQILETQHTHIEQGQANNTRLLDLHEALAGAMQEEPSNVKDLPIVEVVNWLHQTVANGIPRSGSPSSTASPTISRPKIGRRMTSMHDELPPNWDEQSTRSESNASARSETSSVHQDGTTGHTRVAEETSDVDDTLLAEDGSNANTGSQEQTAAESKLGGESSSGEQSANGVAQLINDPTIICSPTTKSTSETTEKPTTQTYPLFPPTLKARLGPLRHLGISLTQLFIISLLSTIVLLWSTRPDDRFLHANTQLPYGNSQHFGRGAPLSLRETLGLDYLDFKIDRADASIGQGRRMLG